MNLSELLPLMADGVRLVDENHFLYEGKIHYISEYGLQKIRDSGTNETPRMEEVVRSIAWIRRFCEPQKTINPRSGSYTLKHIAERYTQNYIGNGAFILAALLLGYRYEHNGMNATFNMSFRKWNLYCDYIAHKGWRGGVNWQRIPPRFGASETHKSCEYFLKKYANEIPWFVECDEESARFGDQR